MHLILLHRYDHILIVFYQMCSNVLPWRSASPENMSLKTLMLLCLRLL